MSDSDLDIYSNGGQVVPFAPDQPLAPTADEWGLEDSDFITERPSSPSSGDLPAHVERNLGELTAAFYADFTQLNHPQSHIQQSVQFFRSMLKNPPTSMPAKHHNYPSMFQLSADPMFMAFCNFAWTIGATPQFIQSVCWWLQEIEKRADQVARGNDGPAVQSPRMAPSSDPLDSLSDADYEAVVRANDNARAATMDRLRQLWGDSFQANLAMVDRYFGSLPANEQKHLSQMTAGWISGTNTFEVVHGLYQQAIGQGSIPKTGAGIAQEIAAMERVMKYERKKWNSDNQLQSRYRELIRMRDNGR
jgi:hypothetical protein